LAFDSVHDFGNVIIHVVLGTINVFHITVRRKAIHFH
jgi:hypothetical protein